MYKSSDGGNRSEVVLSTARIIRVQPLHIWPRSQPILRQALLSQDKTGDGTKSADTEGGKTTSRQKRQSKSDTEFPNSIQLYTPGSSVTEVGDASEYSVDLLAGLPPAGTLPTLTPSQLSTLLSEIDAPVQAKTTNVGAERRVPDPKEKSTPDSGNACMERRGEGGKNTWYFCPRCEHVCLSESKAVAHPNACPGRPTKINCLACENSFRSKAVLKAHLLIDHSVSVDDHPAFIAMHPGSHHGNTGVNMNHSAVEHPSDTTVVASPEDDRPSVMVLPEVDLTASLDAVSQAEKGSVPRAPGFSLFETVDRLFGESECEKDVSAACLNEEKGKEQSIEDSPTSKGSIKLEKSPKLRCSVEGCSAKLSSQSNLDYHRLCHNSDGWKCPECGSSTHGSWPSLTIHLWRRHSLDLELYSCDQCSYKTNSLSKLMNLHRRTHGNERPFLCDLCGKGFKTTKQLRNHKAVHRKGKESPDGGGAECGTCGRKFACARLLRQHSDIVHRKLRPYLCADCGHSAASRSSLRMHARQHTGEKPYKCGECDFSTPDHNTLRRHRMRHSGARPYACPHCSYASIQSSTYKAHLRSKHPGLDEGLMYSCEVCPFRTVKRDNFLAHASHHTLRTTDSEYGNLSPLRSPEIVGPEV